jgi:transcriptional regulator with XRE-family HTH domain
MGVSRMQNPFDDYMTVPELAKALGVSVRTIQRWEQQRSGHCSRRPAVKSSRTSRLPAAG